MRRRQRFAELARQREQRAPAVPPAEPAEPAKPAEPSEQELRARYAARFGRRGMHFLKLETLKERLGDDAR